MASNSEEIAVERNRCRAVGRRVIQEITEENRVLPETVIEVMWSRFPFIHLKLDKFMGGSQSTMNSGRNFDGQKSCLCGWWQWKVIPLYRILTPNSMCKSKQKYKGFKWNSYLNRKQIKWTKKRLCRSEMENTWR